MVLPVSSEVEWGGLHGLQVENLESTRSPSGIHLEPDNNLAGLPAKKIPPGLHVENVESWIPPGFHLESMGEGKVLERWYGRYSMRSISVSWSHR